MANDSFPLTFGDEQSLVLAAVPAPLLTEVAPLAIRSKATGETDGIGTAFSLMALASGDALFATARHNFFDRSGQPLDVDEMLLLLPAGVTDEGAANTLVGLPIVDTGWMDEYSDVALLLVDLKGVTDVPFEGLICRFPLALSEPVVGAATIAVGYPVQQYAPNNTATRALQASQGIIKEVHPTALDSFLFNFPAIETDSLFHNGMSGGPLLTTDGRVIGVISHGLPAGEDNARPCGFAMPIGALMELAITLRYEDGRARKFTMQELTDLELLDILVDSRFHLSRDADGLTISWL